MCDFLHATASACVLLNGPRGWQISQDQMGSFLFGGGGGLTQPPLLERLWSVSAAEALSLLLATRDRLICSAFRVGPSVLPRLDRGWLNPLPSRHNDEVPQLAVCRVEILRGQPVLTHRFAPSVGLWAPLGHGGRRGGPADRTVGVVVGGFIRNCLGHGLAVRCPAARVVNPRSDVQLKVAVPEQPEVVARVVNPLLGVVAKELNGDGGVLPGVELLTTRSTRDGQKG